MTAADSLVMRAQKERLFCHLPITTPAVLVPRPLLLYGAAPHLGEEEFCLDTQLRASPLGSTALQPVIGSEVSKCLKLSLSEECLKTLHAEVADEPDWAVKSQVCVGGR